MSTEIGGRDCDRLKAPLLDGEEDMDAITMIGQPEQKTPDMERDRSEQNDEGQSGRRHTQQTNDNGPDGQQNQMMFVVLTSVMLVLISVTFSQSLAPFTIKEYGNPSVTSRGILIIYMLVGSLIIIAMLMLQRSFSDGSSGNGGRHGPRNNIKTILQDYLSIVGMSFFFPFACILDLSHIIAAVSCDEIWKLCGNEYYGEYLVDVFYHLIRILFMGAELAFCCKFHETRFQQNGLVRCGLMIVMAANLGLWFLSLVYEAVEREGHHEGEGKRCSNDSDHTPNQTFPDYWQSCVHQSSNAHQVLSFMIRYLYPFAIEFSLLVGEFLATKFVSNKQQAAGDHRENTTTEGTVDSAKQPQTPGNDSVPAQRPQRPEYDTPQPQTSAGGNVVDASPLLTTGDRSRDLANQVPASAHRIARLGRLLSVFIMATFLFSSFLYITLAFTDSFADGRNKTEIDSVNWGKVYEIYSIINYTLTNVLIVIGYICGYALQIDGKKLHGLDWLVLISAFGPFIRQLITITALAASYTDMSPEDFPAILICSRLANWIQLILQAPFVFLAERWRLTDEQRSQPSYLCRNEVRKAIIFCLAVLNLTNWISDSIIITNSFSIKNDLTERIFEVRNWIIFDRISLPLMIFYRFSSFLLFTRAYIGD